MCWHLVPVSSPGCCAPSQQNAVEFLPLGTHRLQNERAELSLSCCAALLSSLQPQSSAGTSLACPPVPFPCGSGGIAQLGFRLGLWQSSGSVSLQPGTAAATVPRRDWCWMHQMFSWKIHRLLEKEDELICSPHLYFSSGYSSSLQRTDEREIPAHARG